MNKMKYFAYGSNMDKDRMLQRGLNFTSRQFAKLEGYKLVFNKKSDKQGMVANIEQSKTDSVEGVLYEFPDNEIKNLDSIEGYPNHYDRIKIIVLSKDDTPTEATTYIAKQDKIVNGLYPKKEYLSHLLAGQDILSKEYFDNLSKTKTYD